jgi:hypothetical protein
LEAAVAEKACARTWRATETSPWPPGQTIERGLKPTLVTQAAADERPSVCAPRQREPEHAGDRRHDVDVPRQPVVDPSGALARKLHEQRHKRDLVEVLGRREAPLVAEAHAVIRGHDHERAVVDTGLA